MAEKKGAKKALEKGGNAFRGVMDKKQHAEDTIDDSIQKITSPIDQKQAQLDSTLSKVDEPFEAMEDKQMQANMAVNASKEKADAASKLLDAKELAHQEGANKSNNVMSGAKTRANRATSSIEDRQQNFGKLDELVRSLKEKIKSQSKSLPDSAPGSEI